MPTQGHNFVYVRCIILEKKYLIWFKNYNNIMIEQVYKICSFLKLLCTSIYEVFMYISCKICFFKKKKIQKIQEPHISTVSLTKTH